jgi:hypothetical protein
MTPSQAKTFRKIAARMEKTLRTAWDKNPEHIVENLAVALVHLNATAVALYGKDIWTLALSDAAWVIRDLNNDGDQAQENPAENDGGLSDLRQDETRH